jgi:hypothetical protein
MTPTKVAAKAAPKAAAKETTPETAVDRRGPQRAKNVVRPAFGATTKPAPAAPSRVMVAAESATDEWESF